MQETPVMTLATQPLAPLTVPHERETASIDYIAFQAKPEFQAHRSRFRRFVFPMAGLFLAWYFTFVALTALAPEFMATPVFGFVNVGIVFGLLQFASTFAITTAYFWFANTKLDPQSATFRSELEAMERGEVAL